MKKILFALAGALTLALTACMEDTGSRYTSTFSRIVTIDDASSTVKFIADYTGEEFSKFENIKYTEQLGEFGLSDARRAEIYMKLDVDASYYQTLTLLQAQKIDVQVVTNKKITEETMPFVGWQQKPLSGNYTPTVWVSNGYLNVTPQVPSNQSGKYYLTADSVAGDTLFFNLNASFHRDDSQKLIDYLQCYDLRTLRDTADADPELRVKMREVLDAMKQHRNDSMRIVLTGDFIVYNYNYQGRDTIVSNGHITNYFKCNF